MEISRLTTRRAWVLRDAPWLSTGFDKTRRRRLAQDSNPTAASVYALRHKLRDELRITLDSPMA
jgi:hypothetical protein